MSVSSCPGQASPCLFPPSRLASSRTVSSPRHGRRCAEVEGSSQFRCEIQLEMCPELVRMDPEGSRHGQQAKDTAYKDITNIADIADMAHTAHQTRRQTLSGQPNGQYFTPAGLPDVL